MSLLEVENIIVDLPTPRGMLRAVDGVNLTLDAGRTLGVVGESGSGKTMLSRAILQLLPRKAKLSGAIRFDGQDMTRIPSETLRILSSPDRSPQLQLAAFRIRNFRSIVDSGWVMFSPDGITVLVGQNESGKSSVLEALYFALSEALAEIHEEGLSARYARHRQTKAP